MKVLDRSVLLEMVAALLGTLKDLGDRDGEAAAVLRKDIQETLFEAGQDLNRRAIKLVQREGLHRAGALMLAIATCLKGEELDFELAVDLLDSLGVDQPDMPVRGHSLDDLGPWEMREELSDK